MVVGKEELNDCVVVCRFWTPGVDFGAVGVAVLSVEGLEGSEGMVLAHCLSGAYVRAFPRHVSLLSNFAEQFFSGP